MFVIAGSRGSFSGSDRTRARKGPFKMPWRKSLPVKVSRPQKDRSRLKGVIPLEDLLTGTPRIGGELRMRGSNGPTWIPFEAQFCDDVVVHDESTDRTNGDRTDSSPGRHALFRR
jgi:hypothetical protein